MIAAVPTWMIELLDPPKRQDAPSADAKTTDGAIPAGARNTTLTSLAGTMRRRGMSEASIVAALLAENQRCVDENGAPAPLAESEVRAIAKSVGRYSPDDPSDSDAASASIETCRNFKARMQETGDAKLAFDPDCLRAAHVVRTASPRLWAELCDLLRPTRQLTEWKNAVKDAGRELENEQRSAGDVSDLPSIMISDRQLRDVISDSTLAILSRNAPQPFLFVRDGLLVRLFNRETGAALVVVTVIALFALLAQVADWFRRRGKIVEACKPEVDVARILVEQPPPGLPPLQTIVTAPLFAADGTLINAVGYHRNYAVYFDPKNSIVIDSPPTTPTDEEVQRAVHLFKDDLLVDFPFESEADFATAMAAFVLPFVRRMVDGCVPLHLFEASTPGAGKTLIAKLDASVVTGKMAEIGVLPPDDPETRKRLTSVLSTSPQIVIFDNAPQQVVIDSSVLAAAVTSETWTDRLLGVSKIVTLRNDPLYILTANNARLSMELARRSVRCRLAPSTDRPWERKGFKHPKIELWAKENRARLIRAIVVLVNNWLAKGRPAGSASLGSFESWAAVIGGILEAAGIKGLLANQAALYENADTESELWRGFVGAWFSKFGSDEVSATGLLVLASETDALGEIIGEGDDHSRATRLGKQLVDRRDRVYGKLRIEIVRNCGKRGRKYRVVPVDEKPVSTGDASAPNGPSPSPPRRGDVGDVAGDVESKGPQPQEAGQEPVTTGWGRGKPDSESSAPLEKTKPDEAPVSFFVHVPSTGKQVPHVPIDDASPDEEVTWVRGPASTTSPLAAPLQPDDVPRKAGRPRECLVCGCPDFVELTDGSLACAECPRGPAAGRSS